MKFLLVAALLTLALAGGEYECAPKCGKKQPKKYCYENDYSKPPMKKARFGEEMEACAEMEDMSKMFADRDYNMEDCEEEACNAEDTDIENCADISSTEKARSHAKSESNSNFDENKQNKKKERITAHNEGNMLAARKKEAELAKRCAAASKNAQKAKACKKYANEQEAECRGREKACGMEYEDEECHETPICKPCKPVCRAPFTGKCAPACYDDDC
ncbi:hypothetical protein PAPYR_2644 [Paratrimastix pyriformis]|uniref:Uncharacterized protein n=1 Tax=Paratrimastix pyriformis TaxID=342808 RepID=A0ABQ8UUY6_9EUKA|nr:hypothetical protein PAPYR_2644 [Paratrimastix pyriformis]|eukprot:GAFH01004160.1.p2 GENE.GAFH01004160.1~~GAFH01004160.1.p2  ORF type:complete len:217 (-),score=117.48 GAFH01004160.1:71-721(-)